MSGEVPDKPTMYCRTCQYVLDGAVDSRCPECGSSFDRDNALTFLSSSDMNSRMIKPLRCVVSWLILIAGTYVFFFTGVWYWWIGTLILFFLVRKLGRNRIPRRIPTVRSPAAGCLLSPVLLLLVFCPPEIIAIAGVVFALRFYNAGTPGTSLAMHMTVPTLALYGIFIVIDVLHLRKLSKAPPPGCCVNCHYDLSKELVAIRILSANCPNCNTPLPDATTHGDVHS